MRKGRYKRRLSIRLGGVGSEFLLPIRQHVEGASWMVANLIDFPTPFLST